MQKKLSRQQTACIGNTVVFRALDCTPDSGGKLAIAKGNAGAMCTAVACVTPHVLQYICCVSSVTNESS